MDAGLVKGEAFAADASVSRKRMPAVIMACPRSDEIDWSAPERQDVGSGRRSSSEPPR